LKRDIGDELIVVLNALNLQGGQYKQIITKNLGKFCDALYEKYPGIEDYFNFFHQHAKVKVPWKTCPYSKGVNDVTNLLVDDIGNMLPPYIPGGEKWKIEVRYFENDVVVGGYNIYATLRSEQSLLGH